MISPTLKTLDKGREIQMNVFDFKSTENQKVPKYAIYVVDSKEEKLVSSTRMACLIVPQGREKESIFATEMGR